MAKRIYFQTMKKWASKVGVPVGIASFTLLFIYLSFLGVIEVTGHSNDTICAGTVEDPCYAYINFTAKEDIFIYPVGYDPWGRDTPFETDKKLKSWKIYRSWGTGWREIKLNKTCTGTWCGAPNNLGVAYSFVFRKGRNYQIRIVALKEDPTQDIKWGFTKEVDPVWYGLNIGYEFLDDGKVVHIWNTQDDYFFDKNSGIQFTNYYEDYWSKNIFCIGYYGGGNWNKIKCADELSGFNKDIQTDNSTYVNATLWKDFSYSGYDLRLGVRYHLGLSDKNLSVTIYGKNIGIDIPYDLGFAWKVVDLDVPPETIDKISINNTYYNLDGIYDLTFKNMTKIIKKYNIIGYENVTNETGNFTIPIYEIINETIKIPFYKIYDYDGGLSGKENFLRVDWNENLSYAVKMYGNGNQENFYTALLIDAGHFNPQQEKSTTFYWIDALADNIISYWKFDEQDTTGSGTILDALGANNGTNVGASNSTGKINTSYYFDGDNDYIVVETNVNGYTDQFSMAGWLYVDVKDEHHTIISKRTGAGTDNFQLYRDQTSDRFRSLLWGTTGVSVYADNVVINVTEWYHVVVTYNGTIHKIFVNGILRGTVAATGNVALDDIDTRFGNDWYSGFMNGNLDEVAVWAKALTDGDVAEGETAGGEVAELYNLGDGLQYPFADTIKPTYSLNQTNTTEAGASCMFSILYDDDIALEIAGQYIFSTNNTGDWTNESAVNFTATPQWANVTKTLNSTVGMVVGYRWFADDNAGNINNTPIYTLTTVDTTAPVVTLNTPIDNYNSSSNLIIFNGTASDNIDIANVSLYGNWTGNWSLNETNLSGINNVDYIFTKTISSGLGYIWNYEACDGTGNCAFAAANRTFSIDTVSPIISVQSPTNTTYTTSTIYFNATASEAIDTWIVNYNETNVTHTINTTLTVEDGSHHLFLYGNDSFGNWGVNDTIYFSVDATNPSISYDATTTEAGYQSQDFIFVNITCSDTNKDTVIFNWNTTNESFDNSDGDIYWENKTSLAEGNYTFYAWCNDTFGNSNQTSTRNVALDTTIPDVAIISPENISYDTSSIDFNVSVSADTEFCKFTTNDWATNYTMNEFNSTYYNYTNSSMPDDQYTSKFWCNDSAGNINDTEQITFTVDTTYPLIDITYPANNSYMDTTSLNITGTASDTNPDTISINDTNFGTNLGNYTNWNFTNTSMAEGSYSVQVSANDTANNTNSSILYFTIDRTNPSIYYNPNADSGYVNRDWIFVNVTATDTNLDSVRLEWNGTNETFDNSGNSFYWENQTSLADGNYTFYAWANDSAEHYNFTSTRNVYVDTTAPLINMTYPLNITYNYSNPTYLNYTASDAGIGLDSCWYSTDGGTTNTTVACGTNVTGLLVEEDSTNTWTIWANDSFGQENSSTVTFHSQSPYCDFNISITTNTTLDFHPDNDTHTAVAAENQTDSIGVFTANNNLTVAINVSVKLNETNSQIILKIGNSSNYSLSIAITTSYQIIYRNLTVDSTEYLWAWADYNQTTEAWYPELEIRGINTTYSGG